MSRSEMKKKKFKDSTDNDAFDFEFLHEQFRVLFFAFFYISTKDIFLPFLIQLQLIQRLEWK